VDGRYQPELVSADVKNDHDATAINYNDISTVKGASDVFNSVQWAAFLDPNSLSDPDIKARIVALLRAQKNARRRNKEEKTAEITLPLDLRLCSGMLLAMVGWGPEFSERNWIIKECNHIIGRSRPSETHLKLRMCLPY
jgi:hypothetical protein